MAWIHAHGYESFSPEDAAMVYVGEGNNYGEDWWVVAAVSYSDAWGGAECTGTIEGGDRTCEFPRSDVSFLTNAPSENKPSGEQWINIGRPLGGAPGSVSWGSVKWTEERLARGQKAQQVALSCLVDQ